MSGVFDTQHRMLMHSEGGSLQACANQTTDAEAEHHKTEPARLRLTETHDDCNVGRFDMQFQRQCRYKVAKPPQHRTGHTVSAAIVDRIADAVPEMSSLSSAGQRLPCVCLSYRPTA